MLGMMNANEFMILKDLVNTARLKVTTKTTLVNEVIDRSHRSSVSPCKLIILEYCIEYTGIINTINECKIPSQKY